MRILSLLVFLILTPGLNALVIDSVHAPGLPADFHAEINYTDELPVGKPQKTAVEDLPLMVFGTIPESALPMLVYISGDGGWNKFSSSLCAYLNQKGIPVVVLDAQKYFWQSKTPDETAEDLASVIVKYQKEWKKEKFVLAGFSFGADILPFLMKLFPGSILSGLTSTILISPDKTCDFEIHLSDMLNLGISKGKYDVVKAIASGDAEKYRVVFGSDESRSTQQAFRETGAKIVVLQGGHHFDSDYQAVGDWMVVEMK
jgi:type IV secretory pathway VirJ component